MHYFIVSCLLITIIIMAGWLIAFYNKLVSIKAPLDDSWWLLNKQFRRRSELLKGCFDSIPGAVHIKAELLEDTMQASSSCCSPAVLCDAMKASFKLSEKVREAEIAVKSVEANGNPDLISKVQELTELEIKIKKYRELYNEKAQNYNDFLAKFPNSVAGRILGIQMMPYFFK